MSESMNTRRRSFHRNLLATASIFGLVTGVYSADQVRAEDADRPVLWIELGAQLDQINGDPQRFTPHFLTTMPRPDFESFSPLNIQNPSRYAFGGEGKISFNPEGTDWTISAAIRYGRSHSNAHRTAHTNQPPCHEVGSFNHYSCQTVPQGTIDAIDASGPSSESHTILDFLAGKDVGLGLFGNKGKSVFGFGVRYAQMRLASTMHVDELRDLYFPSPFNVKYDHRSHDRYVFSASSQRNFRGVGPSISWDASAAFAGNPEDGEVTFDWGLGASLLFGRQTVKTHHRTISNYYCTVGFARLGCPAGLSVSTALPFQKYSHSTHTANSDRARSVIVPNLGGFAGLSFRYSDAKLSLGYRADFFFGALDGGIDTRKSTTRGFFGPFASLSIGLGD